jgi:hypothetical protein
MTGPVRYRLDELVGLSPEELQKQTEVLVELIKPVLGGKPPAVQGVVLADLMAMWLAGHVPSAEEELIAAHLTAVRKLVPLYRDLFGTQKDSAGAFTA